MDIIKAIIILNMDGQRKIARYFDDSIDSNHFERKLFVKTKSKKHKEEILMLDGQLILHRSVQDVHLYIVGSRNENPLILDRVLCCLVEVVSSIMSRTPEAEHPFFENLDQIIIAFDEVCDNGIVIETDPDLVLKRVYLKDSTDLTMAQLLQNSKLAWLLS